MVTVEEMKQYLRVEYLALPEDNARTAVLYAVAYLYEHREEADHHQLTLDLRSLLFGIRKEGF